MSITMKQLGARFDAASDKMDPVIEKKLNTFVQAGVGYEKEAIQDYHAVDTGTMLNSTQADKQGKDEYLIGPTTNYAPYVALGTSRMAARPFHVKAARHMNDEAKDFFTAEDLGL